jgi:hypothetical protein
MHITSTGWYWIITTFLSPSIPKTEREREGGREGERDRERE